MFAVMVISSLIAQTYPVMFIGYIEPVCQAGKTWRNIGARSGKITFVINLVVRMSRVRHGNKKKQCSWLGG
jgi:hypothetical protein